MANQSLTACTLYFNPQEGDFSGRFPGSVHLEYVVTLESKEPMTLACEVRNILSSKVEGRFVLTAPDVVVNPLAPRSSLPAELASEDGRWVVRGNSRNKKAPLTLYRRHPKGEVENLGPLAELFSYDED